METERQEERAKGSKREGAGGREQAGREGA